MGALQQQLTTNVPTTHSIQLAEEGKLGRDSRVKQLTEYPQISDHPPPLLSDTKKAQSRICCWGRI